MNSQSQLIPNNIHKPGPNLGRRIRRYKSSKVCGYLCEQHEEQGLAKGVAVRDVTSAQLEKIPPHRHISARGAVFQAKKRQIGLSISHFLILTDFIRNLLRLGRKTIQHV